MANEKSNLPALPTRKITVFSTQEATSYEYNTTVRTFGELKGEVPTIVKKQSGSSPGTSRVSFDGKIVRIRETRHSLEVDAALLPEGESTLFVYPAKSKAGAYKSDEVEKMKYNEVRSLGAIINKKFGAELDLNQQRVSQENLRKSVNRWLSAQNKNASDVANAPAPEKKSRAASATSAPKKEKKVAAPKQVSNPVESKGSLKETITKKRDERNTPHLTVLNQILFTLQGMRADFAAFFLGQLTGGKTELVQVGTEREVEQKHEESLSQQREEQPKVNEESQEELELRLQEEAAQKTQREEAQARQEQEERERSEKEAQRRREQDELKALQAEASDDDIAEGTRGY